MTTSMKSKIIADSVAASIVDKVNNGFRVRISFYNSGVEVFWVERDWLYIKDEVKLDNIHVTIPIAIGEK